VTVKEILLLLLHLFIIRLLLNVKNFQGSLRRLRSRSLTIWRTCKRCSPVWRDIASKIRIKKYPA